MDKKAITPKSKLRMEIKEISAEGAFEGLLSPYGNVDGGADVVEPGAYTKTIKERGSKIPMLWQHKSDMPIGELVLDDRQDGLWCKGQLLMELPEAQKAYLLIKARIVKGLSIGFSTIKDAVSNGVRRLLEIKLYEGSIVTFPMNELALITSVKDRDAGAKGDFNEEFEEIQTLNGFYDMQSALSAALRSVIWADLTNDEKIAASETILQQFTDAFSAFFPAYLAMLDQVYGDGWQTYAASRRLEQKTGAAISASNADKIRSACDSIKGGHDNLLALLEGKAGATTLQTKAATDSKSEPADEDHSVEFSLIEQIQAALH